MLATGHHPGDLAEVLRHFSSRNINMTKLESRPVPDRPFQYRFYLDVDGHSESQPLADALEAIKPHTRELRILGTYPAAERSAEALETSQDVEALSSNENQAAASSSTISTDVLCVGAGIVGLATARALAQKIRGRVVVIEAEKKPALHQTGRNSGVIHSGLYYKPGSLKSQNCVTGRAELLDYCQKHEIQHELCGKLVIATDKQEIERLGRVGASRASQRPCRARATTGRTNTGVRTARHRYRCPMGPRDRNHRLQRRCPGLRSRLPGAGRRPETRHSTDRPETNR